MRERTHERTYGMNHRDNIDRSFDSQLSPDEWEGLQAAILADPDLRRDYVEKRWIHSLLLSEGESLPRLLGEAAPGNAASGLSTVSPASRPLVWWSAAAALVSFCATLFLLLERSPQKTVATLIEAQNCRWAGSDLPTVEGSGLGTGTLALTEGMATIRFESGATVTLEAPSVLEVESAMKCRLLEGSVVADVPESAHGFTIDTAKMKVVDLGTRFGVTATALGDSHVFVFEGEVTVKKENQEEAKHLFTGGSLHYGETSPVADQEIGRLVLPPAPGEDWTPISTATGAGKDTFLRRNDPHGANGAAPLLMVKNTDLAPGNERRAILTFDLSSMDRSRILNAKLSLKMESSGLGFSALVPDSKFAVYGINEDSASSWSENSLIWEDGNSFVAEPLPPGFATRLAGFEIRKGSSNSFLESSSEEMVHFLQSYPGNLLTLMLVRETGEADKQGLVHAFASKEHPTAPAPTLWIQHTPAP